MYKGSDELHFTRAFTAAIKGQASLHLPHGSMTFGRKPFGRNDVWSNATFGRYDVSPTTTFGRLRQLVENSSNYVEIWLKTDLYRKN